MAKLKKVGSAGRFGPRYGRKNRKKIASIEEQTRGPHTCPQCGYASVSRVGAGIWRCAKCKFTFAGGAYVPQTPVGKTQTPSGDIKEAEHGV